VHLVWAPLGPEVVRRFADSYRLHPAGAEHTLTVAYNGFDGPRDPRLQACRDALEGCPHEPLVFEQPVQDLTAYRLVAERLPGTSYCFLNSFTRLLVPDWLRLLAAALATPNVGLAGASGSWASVGSYARFMIGLGGPYGRVFSDRKATNLALAGVEAARHEPVPMRTRWQNRALFARALLDQSHGFPAFPAPHIRTTGFMVRHDVLEQTRIDSPRRKADAYRLESGARSITAQVQAHGLTAVVAGRDGRAHEPSAWPASHTFWSGEQEGLLIADKQTDDYERADGTMRAILSRYAWGPGAPPIS
jgi:hypothetical protein